MTTITMELPDGLAKKLQAIGKETLTGFLEQALADYDLAPAKKSVFQRLPVAPFPNAEFDISLEDWKQDLLAIPTWSDDDIEAIEKARDYINQWQPQTFF